MPLDHCDLYDADLNPTSPPLILGGADHTASDLLAAFDALRWAPIVALWLAVAVALVSAL